MNLTLHKIALILLTTLSIASASENNVSIEQPEVVVQEENIPEKLFNIYRSLIQKCAQLAAEKAEMKQFIEEQYYKLNALQEAYEQVIRENEELQAENDLLKTELNSKE